MGKFKLPSKLLGNAKQVRSFGQINGADELAQPYVTDADNQLEVPGWELSAVMSRICKDWSAPAAKVEASI
ncbi:hypothetical protein OOJ09_12650 [Mesorhizobium qingshengii]|uniref:Uncharacterized protein n=1 Tax=Mesorhizobium qingshengii TaxID=1165689 RepID=A0ABT4QTW8_9HYPH|nr:DUF6882 domain-containing protein [Mesorhizobium qingshengii]MCZ8545036.1 hypothetical protein [Mesorhizobium qingshengii]